MKVWHNIYPRIITLNSVFAAWGEFIKGKRQKTDVVVFERHLEDNLFKLHNDLKTKRYIHGGYKSFYVKDPKLRHIHKASVRDRVVHHLVTKVLDEIFDPTFYTHSYSCRKNMGTHKAVGAFIKMARKISKNNTSSLYVLKCDIKKFFENVDHNVLLGLLERKIDDPSFLWLLKGIITSFEKKDCHGKGMPIGNLTSQLFANIYLDPLDRFMKCNLKIKNYIRYADDFVVFSDHKSYLEKLVPKIEAYLKEELELILHPDKISIRNYYLGIDFLGYVIFPHFVLPRTKTKRRLFRKLHKRIWEVKKGVMNLDLLNQTIQSYLGYLSHANSFKLRQKVKNQIYFWLTR